MSYCLDWIRQLHLPIIAKLLWDIYIYIYICVCVYIHYITLVPGIKSAEDEETGSFQALIETHTSPVKQQQYH